MKLQIRADYQGRIKVLDENGKEIEGVLSVSFAADIKHRVPVVKLELLASVVVDTEAEVPALEKAAKPHAFLTAKEIAKK